MLSPEARDRSSRRGRRRPSPGSLAAMRRPATGTTYVAVPGRPGDALASSARCTRPPRRLPHRPPVDRRRWDARLPAGRRRRVLARAPVGRGRGRSERWRADHRVRRPRLLPQLGAGAQPQRHQGADRPARVLRQHPALGPRQRARARQLLVRLSELLESFHPRACQASRRLGLQPGEPALRAPHRHRLPRPSRARARARAGARDRRAARGVPGERRQGAGDRRGGGAVPRQEGGHLGAAPARADRPEHGHRLDRQRPHACAT